jgi:hypothetical protein
LRMQHPHHNCVTGIGLDLFDLPHPLTTIAAICFNTRGPAVVSRSGNSSRNA